MATTPIVSGVQYSGKWTLQSQAQAVAAGTWTGFPFLYIWGEGGNAQFPFSNPSPANYSSPKQVGTSYWTNASQCSTHGGAVAVTGALWMWGGNGQGQLGLGNATSYSSPKQVGSLTNWKSVQAMNAGGAGFTLALKTNGTLWSWGYNAVGQLGLGNRTTYSSPKQIGALTTWASFSIGVYSFVAAIKTDGTLWAWGQNTAGQLGFGGGSATFYSSPQQVGSLTNWSSVSCGAQQVFAVKTNGTLWSWGWNGGGQLGKGNQTNYSSPVQIGGLTTWLKASGGYSTGGAIKTDGTLWMWGSSGTGALGLGNTTYYSSPKQVGALTNWLNLSAGYYHTLASKTNGTLWSWGYNAKGQLGLGNISPYSSPKQIGAGTGWSFVSAGKKQESLALTT